MASTYSLAAVALEQIINACFAVEGITARHDKIHEALGFNGTAVGIAPTSQQPSPRNKAAMETWVEIRYYGKWDKKITPEQSVDPRLIAEKADRLIDAIRTAEVTKSGDLWFFNVEGIEYPDDPTGNKTRFHMNIRVWSENSALVETTG